MSLDRFTNREEIIRNDGVTTGITWKQSDIDLLQLNLQTITLSDTSTVELHAYVRDLGDYLVGGSIQDYGFEQNTVWIDHAAAMSKFGITRGEFEIVVNIHRPLLGDESNPLLFIKEISPDRRELHLKLIPSDDSMLDGIVDRYIKDYGTPDAFAVALNFGQNKIFKVINQRDWREPDDIVVRLYTPLPTDISENDTLWIIEELIDPFVDNVSLFEVPPPPETYTLRPANFDIDSTYNTITETEFKSWNSLLASNLSTSQQVIDRYFSGSLNGVSLGIDYSSFDNFVFYSSAKDRVDNFVYKLELIEHYSSSISTLQNTVGSDSGSLANNIQINRTRMNSVIGSFDSWERWLYYESTSSLFTHGASGSFVGAQGYAVTPWPKFLSNGSYKVHKVNSTIAQNWYTYTSNFAELYDQENLSALSKTIPEHIRIDSNNSEYELFVNMIGHHFDILYTYITALSKTYKSEEHPKLGVGKEVLYNVAESLGWSLANGKQASSLWQYALGVNTAGSYASTGSLFSKTDEEITTEVWRRIVNNLPYLLKTKGTERSIKALMNTYGIPQTLLSIREYGGPTVSDEAPVLIEDRYNYALRLDGNSYVMHYTDRYSSSLFDNIPDELGVNDSVPPYSREIRFKPLAKRDMQLFAVTSRPSGGEIYTSAIILQHTSSYSGSSDYGRLVYTHVDGQNTSFQPATASSAWVPFYNGEFWNLHWYWSGSANYYNNGLVAPDPVRYCIDFYQKSNIRNTIIRSGSVRLPTFKALVSPQPLSPAGWHNIFDKSPFFTSSLYIGGVTSKSDLYNIIRNVSITLLRSSSAYIPQKFNGYMQEYREWVERLDNETLIQHTLNPTSYIGSLSTTSSFQTLVRRYPFGTDLKAVDLSTNNTIISSSHINQRIKDFSDPYGDFANSNAYAVGFSNPENAERGNFEPVEERYYIKTLSAGANTPRSQKIRIEDNSLVRMLSPTTAGERSSFDYAPVDTNRLGLFYSQADQINKDIFDQFAGISLDDYIGNPEDEFETVYPELNSISREYWKKFSNRNDLNAYIRIFSQFDFTLFNQIKQLLPERADEVLGLLIEPNALERAKIQTTKRPSVSQPEYDILLEPPVPVSTAEYILYTASISPTPLLTESVTVYHVNDNGYDDTGNFLMPIDRGVDFVLPSTYKHIYTIFPYQQDSASAASLGLPLEITGSEHPLITSPTGSIIDSYRSSNEFKLVVYHYSSSVAGNKYVRDKYTAVSKSLGLYYSRSLSIASYNDDAYESTTNLYINGSRITCPGINQNSTISAIGFKPVVEVYETNANQLIFTQTPLPDPRGTSTSPTIAPGNIIVR
jgi:hypothetical protein